MSKIVNALTLEENPTEIETTYLEKVKPLGSFRLRVIELVYHLVKLNKPQILSALSSSDIFAQLVKLLIAYPWNNFLQLKFISLFEDIISNSDHREFRHEVLTNSKIG